MNRKLYVGNLPYEVDEEWLRILFTQVGVVDTVAVSRDRETGRARGFAYVEMSTEGEAIDAVRQFNSRDLGGRAMTVTEARPHDDRDKN